MKTLPRSTPQHSTDGAAPFCAPDLADFTASFTSWRPMWTRHHSSHFLSPIITVPTDLGGTTILCSLRGLPSDSCSQLSRRHGFSSPGTSRILTNSSSQVMKRWVFESSR